MLSAKVLHHLHNFVHLLQSVVVQEAEPGDTHPGLQTKPLVHQLHRVVVPMAAVHSLAVELRGQVGRVRHTQSLHTGLSQVDGKCWGPISCCSAAIQVELKIESI